MDPTRRDLLKTTALGGLATSFAGFLGGTQCAEATAGPVTLPSGITIRPDIVTTRPRPAGQKPVHDLTTKPLDKVRVAHIGLSRGMTHLNDSLNIEFIEVVAVCDLRADRAERAADRCQQVRGKRPEVYGGTEDIWEKMVARKTSTSSTFPRLGPGTFRWPWRRWSMASTPSSRSRPRSRSMKAGNSSTPASAPKGTA